MWFGQLHVAQQRCSTLPSTCLAPQVQATSQYNLAPMDKEPNSLGSFQLLNCQESLHIKRQEVATNQLAHDAYKQHHKECVQKYQILQGLGSSMKGNSVELLIEGANCILEQEATLSVQRAEIKELEETERRLQSV